MKTRRTFKAECSQCGRVFRRKSVVEMLSAIRSHLWKDHKDYMSRRIKAGLKQSRDTNPTIQDLVSALRSGSVRSATGIRSLMTEARYQSAKVVLDAIEPVMPAKMLIAWQAVEAVHDILKRKK